MYKEQKFVASNGIEVLFKHKPRKYDFNHVIFVFSGFLSDKPGNYDFINALSDCPCDVIWINDCFKDMYSYYLCVGMDFSIEKAIKEFIQSKLADLNLQYRNATVTGYSKGGSAAIYYGLTTDISNIVCTVPQMYVGSYVHNNWKHVANHMLGEGYGKSHVSYLNNLMIKALRDNNNLDKNIYLLTSEADKQYKEEILPFLDDFVRYNNFNLFKSYSLFVREHNQVTGHHTALLLGIYYVLSFGATPRFNNGEVSFWGSKPLFTESIEEIIPYVDLREINIREGILFIDGVGLIRGISAEEYSDIDYELIFAGTEVYHKKLAKSHRPNLTREFFEESLVVYDKCWFTTPKYNGIDILDIPKGKYKMSLLIKAKGKLATTDLISQKLGLINNSIFRFDPKTAMLEIK